MRSATRFTVLACAGFLIAAAGLMLTHRASSAQGTPPPLDHFKVYRIQVPQPQTGSAFLRDQFGQGTVQWIGPFFMAPPASKNQEPMHNPRTHLDWYEIATPEPERNVVYQNQFGNYRLKLHDGRYLLVPSLKNEPQPAPPPDRVSHFKCYISFPDGPTPQPGVTLNTQFGNETVVVGPPELFCNPTEKLVPDGNFPILNFDDHLVCYRISPQIPIDQTVNLFDQFISTPALVLENVWLCVPSLKLQVTGAEASTWGKVKTIYR